LQTPGELIGERLTCEVYARGQNEILKLYRVGVSEGLIRNEVSAASAALAAGVRTPAISDTIRLDGRTGIVFERVEGESLTQIWMHQPWRISTIMRQFAELHRHIHQILAPDLRPQRETLSRMVYDAANLSSDDRTAIVEKIEQRSTSEDSFLCHNDYQTDNVVVTPKGPYVFDWADASRGLPAFDVATTVFKLGRASKMQRFPKLRRWLGQPLGRFMAQLYLSGYCGSDASGRRNVEELVDIVAAVYDREFRVHPNEIEQIIVKLYDDGGASAVERWAQEALRLGHSSEAHIIRAVFNVFHRDHPQLAFSYGERALVIDPHDKRLREKVACVKRGLHT
jgi:uncharacterized protein (TIGR02172 family)